MSSQSVDTVNSIVFLFSDDDRDLLKSSVDALSTRIAFGSQLMACLDSDGIPCLEATAYLSQEDWQAIATDSVDWIKRWPYEQFAGQSLVEWLRLDDFSLWWQLEGLLYYAGLGRYADAGGLYNAVKLITLVRRIVEEEQPSTVCFVDRGDLRAKILKHLLDTMDIAYQAVDVRLDSPAVKENLAYRIKTGSFHWLWDLRLYLQRRWRGWAYWLSKIWRHKQKDGRLRVLLVSEQGNGVRSYVDPCSGKVRHGDFYFAGVQEALLGDPDVRVIELQLKVPNVGSAPQIEDLGCIVNCGGDYVPIEAFEDLKQISASQRVRRRLGKTWDILRQDTSFRETLVFEGIDLFPILGDQLEAVFLHNSTIQWRRTQSYRKALRHLTPDVVMMNRHKAAMVDACNLEGVPLVEMEHGTWSRFPAVLLRYYQYLDCADDDTRRLLPKTIAVWGPYMRDLLKRWHYPEGHIAVTGYPAYDRLNHLDSSQVCRFAEEIRLDPAKKTIVYMTGNPWMELYQTPQEQVETARALLQAVKALPDVQLVIKAHQYDDADLYRQLRTELDAETHSLVLQRCDTTLLIAASEAIIAKGSSTLLEAAIADKPVIMVNFSSKPDMFEFRNYDIGPFIDDIGKIASAVKTALYDEEARKQMAQARERFVDEWASGADGKASERLTNLLKQLAKEHKA